MDFNPSDAAEPAGPKILDPGEYELRVREAEERVSSKGNPMIAVEFEVSGHPGIIIREYLVASPGALFRVEAFCTAAGLSAQFTAGRLCEADVRNARVRGRITIEEGTDGYPDKNRVEEFMAPQGSAAAVAAPVAAHTPVPDSDIPF